MRVESAYEQAADSYRLGIDLGSGSIGWAAVTEPEDGPPRVLALGVRHFEAGVLGDIESGKDESRATARRDARGPRRLTWRRQHRLRTVFRALQEIDLLPSSEDDSHDVRHSVLAKLDRELRSQPGLDDGRTAQHLLPYLLRAKALDEKLPRHALGRALYHLAQRRGFLSNLKAAKDDEEVGKVKEGIGELEQLIEQSGARTLGEYFSTLDPEECRIRGRWTARYMYQEEFREIWAAQAAYHSDLTDEQGDKLFATIFFQRPLKSQKALIGICDLEPYRRRAPKACLEFQRFRILQKANDLEVYCPDGQIRALLDEERSMLLKELDQNPHVTFGRIRTLLKMKKSREHGRNYSFNLETDGEKNMVGNRTAARLVDILADQWQDMSALRQKQLVDEIISFESEGPLVNRLVNGWGLDAVTARSVAETPFEPGYASLSRRAIGRLLPLMNDGTAFATAKKEVYGEADSDNDPCDFLPPNHQCALLRNLRNPAVERALSELRTVVNALIRQYGKPSRIHVELARELKHARKTRKNITDRNKANQKSREAARRKILDEMEDGRYCTEANLLKVRLAEECNYRCPYTDRQISMHALVGDRPQFDVEHIIPFSRSLNNSYLNKTLCHMEENRNVKGQKTPSEAYGGTDRFQEILARVRRFKTDAKTRSRKLDLFQTEELPDAAEFIERQLRETAYMSRLATEYLGLLFGGQIDAEHKRRVHPIPGRATAYLRHRWELNSLIGHPDKKDRADHRHHAVDALVVALTGPREIQLLSRAAEEAERLGQTGLFVAVDPPWDGFLDQARAAVEAINVSYRVRRRLSGKLHDATIFSHPIPCPDDKGRESTVHHLRTRLEKLSSGDVEKIVDPRVRRLVREKLAQIGGTPDKAFQDKANHPYLTAKDGRIIPIHKVRVRKSDKPMGVGQGSKKRYVKPGSNHHMEIVALLDKDGNEKKWEPHLVSTFDAIQCKSEGETIIERDHGKGRKFKFSLAKGEHVEMEHKAGKKNLYRTLGISEKEVEFCMHTDARPSTIVRQIKGARVRCSPESLRKANARKVVVDPLGNVLPAND